jgi:hypothetical protein
MEWSCFAADSVDFHVSVDAMSEGYLKPLGIA